MDLLKKVPDPHIFKNFSGSISVESPGRINLIGEHTDYNMGFVMPTAINKKIYFELRKNGDEKMCNILSKTFNSSFSFNLRNFEKSSSTWENYILGVVYELQKLGRIFEGFDCIIRSELPIGAGISSSAALECGLAAGLNELFNLNLSKQEIVFLAQAAENNFVGSNCGIMDQYASVMSRTNHLILLDCLSLEADFIPANLKSCKILLINSKVSHSIADGEYNTRRRECESALGIIQTVYSNVQTLRDVSRDMLEEVRNGLNRKEFNRVQFVLDENERVLKSRDKFMNGELQEVGKLMYQSHYGLRDLYEVSCKELDFLVKYTEDKEFVYGSRMMGGGFGGCTINLIEADKISEFEEKISKAYKDQFHILPEFITVIPAEGTIVRRL